MRKVDQLLYFKACPRCRGDMNTNRDIYGNYKVCLQCGYMLDLGKPDILRSQLRLGPRSKKKAA